MKKVILLLLVLMSATVQAQYSNGFDNDDNLKLSGDIFNDFNEDLEAAQVMEDERFYRYSRFFGVNIGLGFTSFSGNRGAAFSDGVPSYNISVMYFTSFQNAFTLGLSHSRHYMVMDTHTNGNPNEKTGLVYQSMLRPYMGYRYYVDTSDLGTAITYANPYFTGRLEYWYQSTEYPESKTFTDETGGGLGTGIGVGLEFPIELKKTYWNVEFLYHVVSFHDKYTTDWREVTTAGETSTKSFKDLSGDVYTIFVNYHISW